MNILMFGPNGSGKGTQGALIKKAFGLAHIESGAIFREHVGGGTELGKKAKEYMDRGELVPDAITIPMVLETLKTKGADGWLLDGFPRNIAQAEQLHKAMQEQGMKLDYVVEIDPVSYTHLHQGKPVFRDSGLHKGVSDPWGSGQCRLPLRNIDRTSGSQRQFSS